MPMMKRLVVGVVLFVAIWGGWSVVRRWIPDYVEYRGQKIKLTKYYPDFDEYKNDPNNIDPSETARVQQLMLSARIDRQFPTREAVFRASSDVVFPGYGSGGLNDVVLPGGDSLTGFSVEIPRLDKERYFIFRSHNGVYTLVDDFVDNEPLLIQMRLEGGAIVFFDVQGKPALRRQLNEP